MGRPKKTVYTNNPVNHAVTSDRLSKLLNTLCITAVAFTGLRYAVHTLAASNVQDKPEQFVSVYSCSNEVLPPIVKPPASQSGTVFIGNEQSAPAAEAEDTAEKAKWVLPIDGGVTSAFASRVDPFGSGKTEYHVGIDLSADGSTDIHAFADGTVKEVFFNSSYGNAVLIDHGGGMETLYAHCRYIDAVKGDRVNAGQIIACAGDTGRATAVHLHFEVRINGKAVDPSPYLAQASAA